jgi:hypothetical protein
VIGRRNERQKKSTIIEVAVAASKYEGKAEGVTTRRISLGGLGDINA